MSAAPSPIKQTNRLLAVETPLGADVLLIEQFRSFESVSGLYSFDLDLLADAQLTKDKSVNPDSLIGKGVTVALELDGGQRYMHGVVRRLVHGHRSSRFVQYRMELVPWAWLLTLRSNCKIFQNVTTVDIVKSIFDELKGVYPEVDNYRDETRGSHVKWDYCVQYRETDFNFVSPLMVHHGIFYFFAQQ